MNSRSIQNLRIIYILYMIGAFIWAPMIVGVILAYLERGKITDVVYQSHVTKQIRIFWIWLLVVGILYTFVFATVGTSLLTLLTGYGMWGAFTGVRSLVSFSFLVTFLLFLYVLITSIRSLGKLDAAEPITSK